MNCLPVLSASVEMVQGLGARITRKLVMLGVKNLPKPVREGLCPGGQGVFYLLIAEFLETGDMEREREGKTETFSLGSHTVSPVLHA